ncbi:hypothetical protein DPMN_075832, partial [Dreissena polymorpha]
AARRALSQAGTAGTAGTAVPSGHVVIRLRAADETNTHPPITELTYVRTPEARIEPALVMSAYTNHCANQTVTVKAYFCTEYLVTKAQ